MAEPAEDDQELPRGAAAENHDRWALLVARHQDRLLRLVTFRLDRRLQGRIDPGDVLQETYLEAFQRLPDYLRRPTMPFFLWLRFLTLQKLQELHRHHLEAEMRDAGQEVSLDTGLYQPTLSAALAAQFRGQSSQPLEAIIRGEVKLRLQEALNRLQLRDREVLVLRHYEQLSNAETAHALEIQEAAASKRYVRALQRLRELLGNLPPE